MTSLRVGLWGAETHAAEVTVPTLRSTPGMELTAIASMDRHAQELASTWGVEGVQATVQEFLSVGEFDAIVLSDSPSTHEAALAVAGEIGMPVYVQTPPALGAAPLRRYAEMVGKRDKPVASFVGFNLRYAATTRTALELVAAHGRISHVAMDFHTSSPRAALWGRDPLDSFLLASGIHALGVMAEVLDWPAAETLTSAEVTQTRKDDCFVTADFTTRTTRGSLRMSNTRNRLTFATTVTCVDGWSVAWDLDEVVVYSPGAQEETHQIGDPLLPGGERAGHAAAMREFRDACRGKAESRSTIAQAVVVMEWIERLRA
jgi:predicted dehydrogenase